jgi:hypothetical protein
VADRKKNDGLGRIRTGDLRHVKAGDLALEQAFSDFSAFSSLAAPPDPITTRKASAPS